MTANIFVEMSLKDGINFVSKEKEKCFLKGQRISKASGSALFVRSQHNLKCVCCGLKADKWLAFESKSQYPVLNLYGRNSDGLDILFTQDHIIPKVFGGNDFLQNLRVMCSVCNGTRSCFLDNETLVFFQKHMNYLVLPARLQSSLDRLSKGLENRTYQTFDAEIILNNFDLIFKHLKENNVMNEAFKQYEKIVENLFVVLEVNKKEEERLKVEKLALKK